MTGVSPNTQHLNASENSLDPTREHLEEGRGELAPTLPRASKRQRQVTHRAKPALSEMKRATGKHPMLKNTSLDSIAQPTLPMYGEAQELLPGENGAPMYGPDGEEALVE